MVNELHFKDNSKNEVSVEDALKRYDLTLNEVSFLPVFKNVFPKDSFTKEMDEAIKEQVDIKKSYFLTKNAYKHPRQAPKVEGGIARRFTIREAIELLKRTTNRKAIKLALDLENSTQEKLADNGNEHLVHDIAEALYQKYGGKICTFVLGLPIYQGGEDVDRVFLSDPKLRLDELYLDSIEVLGADGKRYYIGFDELEPRKINMLICNSLTSLMARINTNGQIVEDVMNDLTFGIYETLRGGVAKIYSGALNEKCSICNKPLTDPESIYYGIGPICHGRFRYRK